jgi:hypothetical protein
VNNRNCDQPRYTLTLKRLSDHILVATVCFQHILNSYATYPISTYEEGFVLRWSLIQPYQALGSQSFTPPVARCQSETGIRYGAKMYSEPDPGLPRVSIACVSWPLEITAPKRPCRSGKWFGLKGGQLHHLGIGGRDCDCKRAGQCHESFSSPIFMRLVFVCTLSSYPTPPLQLSLMFCAPVGVCEKALFPFGAPCSCCPQLCVGCRT